MQKLIPPGPSVSISESVPTPPGEARMREDNEDVAQIKVRLPVINFPQFSGSYRERIPFYDAFNSLIHDNTSLKDCQKFHYLKSCLKGEASHSLKALTVSKENYSTAWSLLQKRYKNNRLIGAQHAKRVSPL